MDAAHGRVAEIIRTQIAVITLQECPRDTVPVSAKVPLGADIPIAALQNIGGVLASGQQVAGIIGAGVTIIAIGGDPWNAVAVTADIPNGAGITIVTQQVVVGRDQAAGPADRVATGRQADRTRAFWGRTIDNRIGIHPALIG